LSLQKVLNSQNVRLKENKDKLQQLQQVGKDKENVVVMEKPKMPKASNTGEKFDQSSWQGSFAPLRAAVSVSENMCSWTDAPTKLPDIQVL
jgi:hypothetical protein